MVFLCMRKEFDQLEILSKALGYATPSRTFHALFLRESHRLIITNPADSLLTSPLRDAAILWLVLDIVQIVHAFTPGK